jgi:hypothetical protein
MKIRVISQFKVSGDDNLDSETDQLHTAILNLEQLDRRLSNGDVTAVLRLRIVSISIVVDAASWDEAGEVGSAVIVQAIEQVGGRVSLPGADSTDTSADLESHLEARIQSTELVPA